jgi:hypothetical protein
MKAHFSTKPPVIQNQNNGSTLYNYDIELITQNDQQTGIERTSYKCNQVIIFGELTKKKIKKAIIEAEISGDDEKKLINDYSAFQLNILTDEKYQINYLAFLARRKEIKEMVDNDSFITVNE